MLKKFLSEKKNQKSYREHGFIAPKDLDFKSERLCLYKDCFGILQKEDFSHVCDQCGRKWRSEILFRAMAYASGPAIDIEDDFL